MKNMKKFWAIFLASAMTVQALSPAGAEMIAGEADYGISETADIREDEAAGLTDEEEDAEAAEAEAADASAEAEADEISDLIEDGDSADIPSDSESFDDIELLDEEEPDDASSDEDDGLIEDEELELVMAGLDEFDQADLVVYDANDNEAFATRTKQDVADKLGAALNIAAADDYIDGVESSYYTTMASTEDPYNQGVLADSTIASMNAMTDYFRWLAGVGPLSHPYTTNSASMQYQALDRNFEFDHEISNDSKPADMPQDLWDMGFALDHNIIAWRYTPRESIKGWINEGYDLEDGTWDQTGHRTALLADYVSGLEFGYSGLVAIGKYHQDSPNGMVGAFSAFPAPSYMPNNLINANEAAWSCYLNFDNFKKLTASNLKVRVTDMSTGDSYLCTSANKKLITDIRGNIHFVQPTPAGGINAKYTVPYKVEIIGLKDIYGRDAKIQYTVNFVDVLDITQTKIAKYSIHSTHVLTKVDTSDEWLNKVKATMPATVYAVLESGKEIVLPVKGEWKLDKTNQCFTAEVDTSAMPANVIIPARVGTTISVPYEQEDCIYTDNAYLLFDKQTKTKKVLSGQKVTFTQFRSLTNADHSEIYRLTPAGSSYVGTKAFDNKTSEGFAMDENRYYTYTKAVTSADDGMYLSVFYIEDPANYRQPEYAAARIVANETVELTVMTSVTSSQITITGLADQDYTGSAITPAFKVMDGTKELKSGTDYSYTISSNINAGTASIRITGKGKYIDSRTVTFKINPKQVPAPSVTGAVFYTGSAVEPAVTVKDPERNVTLTAGTDYTVKAYADNLHAGTATVTVEGKGNYKGTSSGIFTIIGKSLSADWFAAIPAQTYTGSAITPALSVKDADRNVTLKLGTDFTASFSNNVNAGNATVTITGKGDYSGTQTKIFRINPKQLPAPAAIGAQDFTGKSLTPSVTVHDAERNVDLVKDKDFEVSYTSTVNAGTAAITVTGKGNYTGTKTVNFRINTKALPAMNKFTAQTYTGSAITPEAKIYDSGRSIYLENGTDYTVAYSENLNAGTATVTATGIGNYSGVVSETFVISPKQVPAPTLKTASFAYNGSEIKPELTVKDAARAVNLGSDDYEIVSYTDNVNAGTATVTIKGKGNYTGTASTTFQIKAKGLRIAYVSPIEEQTYTGSPITPAFTVTDVDNNTVLELDKDYTFKYTKNTDAGDASVTLTGIGNYSGWSKVFFTIKPKELPEVPEVEDQLFEGSPIYPTITLHDNELNVELAQTKDYSVAYDSNLNVGTATVTFTGKGNYTGTRTVSFEITPRTLTRIDNIKPQTYTGSEITPTVTIYDGGRYHYVEEENYTLTYSDNVEAGTATVTAVGKGNYAGTSSITFEIVPKELPAPKQIRSYKYTGEPVEADVEIVDDEAKQTLVRDKDFTVAYENNVELGFATVTLTGIGNYTGTQTAEFEIVKYSFKVDEIGPQGYTGKAVTPEVVVKDEEQTLVLNKDYTLEFRNNTAVGTAEAVVTGLGLYDGVTETAEFMIGFADVQDSTAYYFKPVYWAVLKGITNGYPDDNTFRPQDTCTRGQMVTFLWRLAGKPKPRTTKNPFKDVKSTDYYYKAVLWAVEKGITKGYSEDNTFRPDAACQREHAVMFLWRLAGKPTPKTVKNPFTDISKADYYYQAALWASENRIANGYTAEDGSSAYQPKDDCMREHIVTFLYRYSRLKK